MEHLLDALASDSDIAGNGEPGDWEDRRDREQWCGCRRVVRRTRRADRAIEPCIHPLSSFDQRVDLESLLGRPLVACGVHDDRQNGRSGNYEHIAGQHAPTEWSRAVRAFQQINDILLHAAILLICNALRHPTLAVK
jgi:hypothetical protein